MKPSLKVIALLLPLFLLSTCAAASPIAPAAKTKEPITYKNTVVSLTFDDGDADNYQARSILKKNNLRATFYVISGFTGIEGYMSADELRGLYADGNEIGEHTVIW
jgi:peptidoglycan/xylan/chitin deacetylase (PgdA/CDA1 family)